MIREYQPTDKKDCLKIFTSNSDLYFADHEKQEYSDFLDSITQTSPYFVLFVEGMIIGCGGYALYDNAVTLTWGMIERTYHGQGYGTQLVNFRLEKIRNEFSNTDVRIETSQHTQLYYQKRGFSILEIVPDGFAPGLDKYVMQTHID